jgi:quinol monooxygenase YgiN
MFVHIWRMRARKKRVEEYEKFGRQVTLPSLKKIDGCLGAHFIRLFQSRKPEYLWLVYWRDQKALEQARTNPLWREQIKRFEAGKFYKSIPLELVCETVESFTASLERPQRAARSAKATKPAPAEEPEKEPSEDEALPEPSQAEEPASLEPPPVPMMGPTVEGE